MQCDYSPSKWKQIWTTRKCCLSCWAVLFSFARRKYDNHLKCKHTDTSLRLGAANRSTPHACCHGSGDGTGLRFIIYINLGYFYFQFWTLATIRARLKIQNRITLISQVINIDIIKSRSWKQKVSWLVKRKQVNANMIKI